MLPLAARRNRLRRTETRPLALRLVHDFAELRHLAPALDGLGADAEEGSDLLVRALHAAELFKLGEIDLRLRARHDSFLLVRATAVRRSSPRARGTILQVRDARRRIADSISAISRRHRSIHAATAHSFGLHLLERPAVSLERRLLPVRFCQRSTTTSTYFGSSSMPQQTRSVISAAASVVPLPRKGS